MQCRATLKTRPSVPAHLRGGGWGRKTGDDEVLPMCHICHDTYDGRRKTADGRLIASHEDKMAWLRQMLGVDDPLEHARQLYKEWKDG